MGKKEDELYNPLLVEAGLIIKEVPLELSGAKTFVRGENKVSKIVGRYMDLKEKVQCSCSKKVKHKNGWLVQIDNGKQALIGNDCAVNEFGAVNWTEVERTFSNRQHAITRQKMVDPARERAHSALNELKSLKTSIEQCKNFFEELNKTFPNLYKKLLEVHGKQGQWIVATTEKRIITDRFGKTSEKFEKVYKSKFSVDGWKAIFRYKPAIAAVEVLTTRAIEKLKGNLPSAKLMKEAHEAIAEAEQSLADVKEALNSRSMFFSFANWKRICDEVQSTLSQYDEKIEILSREKGMILKIGISQIQFPSLLPTKSQKTEAA
jgi:hypothetical protein